MSCFEKKVLAVGYETGEIPQRVIMEHLYQEENISGFHAVTDIHTLTVHTLTNLV